MIKKELFTDDDKELLLNLLRIPTVNPLESTLDASNRIKDAQECYASAAAKIGFEIILHSPAPFSALKSEYVPLSVRSLAEKMGIGFLETQPNLVLRLGSPQDISRTVMFNFHIDTVGGTIPVRFTNNVFHGRGAVDMKGPGVAILSGIRAGLNANPNLTKNLAIIIQCVPGEEGGAMGVYGTRVLVEQGFIGILNIFAEPSDGFFFDHSTSSATALIQVMGDDSVDDEPQLGHNATLLLGFMADYFATNVANKIEDKGGKICIGGIHTGEMHNRVYGSGFLKFNVAYNSDELGKWIESEIYGAYKDACIHFRSKYKKVRIAQRMSTELDKVCTFCWIKRGLPVLANRHETIESILELAGIHRSFDEKRTFTCDAIWAQRQGLYTIVYGPGSLKTNGAHTSNEYIEIKDLENYAHSVSSILQAISNKI